MRNPDIVASIAASEPRPYTVGFAAETRDLLNYAREKLARKNLDMIVANNVADQSIGFNSDLNEATVIWRNGEQPLPRSGKGVMARKVIRMIAGRLAEKE